METPDFTYKLVSAEHWMKFSNLGEHGSRALWHWMPVSFRAKAWLNAAAYTCQDKKLQKEVRSVFSHQNLSLSLIDEDQFSLKIASRVKSSESLVQRLDGMEKIFLFGYKKGFYQNVMCANPAPQDFWAFITCMADEPENLVREKFAKSFAKSTRATLDRLILMAALKIQH